MSVVIDTVGTSLEESSSARRQLDPEAVARVEVARANLHGIVDRGLANTRPVLQRVMRDVPQDAVVHGKGLEFFLGDGDKPELQFGDKSGAQYRIHPNALGQLADRAQVPQRYLNALASGEKWQREIARDVLQRTFNEVGDRYLVRSVGGVARGVLSKNYRRLDTPQLLNAVVASADALRAIPYEALASDVRTSVKFILPKVHEPAPGEIMIFGLDWQHSDYGKGPYAIKGFAIRLVCLNGMTGESELRQIHIGRALDDNIEWSQQTYEKDTAAMCSATGDVVRGVLGPKQIDLQLAAIRNAHAREVDVKLAFASVRKDLSKAEMKAIEDKFESTDTIVLPPGRSAWRASNALSALANDVQEDNPERSMELQALAGKIAN